MENHAFTPLLFWDTGVWSDENKVNLNGPNGSSRYWKKLQNYLKVFSKRLLDGPNGSSSY